MNDLSFEEFCYRLLTLELAFIFEGKVKKVMVKVYL